MNIPDSPSRPRLGWHWLWFFPVCFLVLLFVELHTVKYAFKLLKLGFQRWEWGVLFSPSAYLCLSIVVISVDWPIRGLFSVASLVRFNNDLNADRRWLYLLVLIIGIFLLPFITEALMWGTFPFCIDDQGNSRLRLIPFLPWPGGNFGEY